MNRLDKYRGCLLGGAAGDALGYPVEFDSRSEMLTHYGPGGITDYTLQDGVARISDDTQLTLFTANALLSAATRKKIGAPGGTIQAAAAACYQDWLRTQKETYPLRDQHAISWLVHVPALFHRRAPGGTCLDAIARGAWGTMEHPINQSKGCGGIMRVAPAGLFLQKPGGAGLLAARLAAMTHGHELGYIPAGILGYCVSALSHGETDSILKVIRDSMDWAARQFAGARYLSDLIALLERAIRLAREKQSDAGAIRVLGEGWVAEETLAIAVYCGVKYEDDFDGALITAVNHDGDSDSTGAVTGNLLGAKLGLSGIPRKYLEHLELKPVILELAEDLCRGVPPAYGKACPPMVHVIDAPMPEPYPLTPEHAQWEAKYDTAVYVPPQTE